MARRNGPTAAIRPGPATADSMSVGDLPDCPFPTFRDLQEAIADKRYSVGVDPLAAAEWLDLYGGRLRKSVVSALSLLLVLAAIVATVAALVLGDYWLLAAIPIQAGVFYVSHPASGIRKWVTVGGALSVIVFIDLLFNGLPTAATLAAYAGLTFAAVRAAGIVANSAFRKELAGDEALFVEAFRNRACTLRDSKTKRVYAMKS